MIEQSKIELHLYILNCIVHNIVRIKICTNLFLWTILELIICLMILIEI